MLSAARIGPAYSRIAIWVMLRRSSRFRLVTQDNFSAEPKEGKAELVFPAFGIPILVAALAVQSPVHVATCEVSAPTRDLNIGTDIGTTEIGGYQLRVRFTNGGNQPITRIVFALNDGSTVVDDGTFAPGVTIDHTFDLMPNNGDSCSVDSATLADGAQWSARPSASVARR
jgi:hypothetical protein